MDQLFTSSDKVEHVSIIHIPSPPLLYTENSEKEVCDHCGIEFFIDHTNAMHLCINPNLGFECDRYDEYLSGCEGGFIEIHTRLCSVVWW